MIWAPQVVRIQDRRGRGDYGGELGDVVAGDFHRPRTLLIASLPGLGGELAPGLGEFGDAPSSDNRRGNPKAYARTAPITRASGTKEVVMARYARNKYLGGALQQWAFCSMRGSAGAKAYHKVLRARKIGQQAEAAPARARGRPPWTAGRPWPSMNPARVATIWMAAG